MKLRDKRTEAIYKIEDIDLGNNEEGIWLGMSRYNSLAELNEDWEDYEEPKEYWFIDDTSSIGVNNGIDKNRKMENFDKQIGNYFETKEEAERAVEKLKAWKRLRDAGVVFKLATLSDDTTVTIFARKQRNIHDYDEELFLLFGGEE